MVTTVDWQTGARSGDVRPISGGDNAAHRAVTPFRVRARTTHRLALDHPPCTAIGEQRGQDGVVELVTAAYRAIGAKHRQAGKREIADDVEHLVAHAFIGVA